MKSKNTCLVLAVLSAMAACGGGNDTAVSAPPTRTLSQLSTAGAAGTGADYSTVVQELYVAYFGRPADSGGLANFQAALAAAGAPADIAQLTSAYGSNPAVRQLIDSFGTSDESNRLYGGDSKAFVTAVYQSIFNRAPLASGLQFWADAIDTGTLTRGNAALSIMSGALNNQTAQGLIDAAAVRNKVAVGASFTAAMVTPANVNGYKGQAAAAAARAMLTAVDSNTDTAQYRSTVAATLARMSVSATSKADSFQWNLVTPAQLVVTDAQGVALPSTGLRCVAVDASALTVAADCSTIQAKRLGAQKITVSGSNVLATMQLTVIPQRQPFGTHGVTSHYGSGDYNLLVTAAGNVQAWGANTAGVLGQGLSYSKLNGSSLPLMVKDAAGTGNLGNIVAVSAGDQVALGLTADGEVLAWGDGQPMTRENTDTVTHLPVKVRNPANSGNLQHVVQVAVGDANAAALADDGTVYSWGYYAGQGTTASARYPNQVRNPAGTGALNNIVAISAGSDFTLALAADGKVYGWGWNNSGETGRGTTSTQEALPATVKLASDNSELTDVVAISAGYNFGLALTADGHVYAWGNNSQGQLGQNAVAGSYYRAVPVKDASGANLSNIKMVSAGGGHVLALDNNDNVLSWGAGSDGQLGDGANRSAGGARLKPIPVVNTDSVGALDSIVAVGAGYNHSLALRNDGTVLIWGDGFNNNLGQGGSGNTDSAVPLTVKNAAGNGPLQLSRLETFQNLLMRGR
ncbi:DUF4214 domain-containing protein [Duganella sp. FT3S]|uniref:DUF4214 domain-containing protein n=1 Tax=Rugamonas fusca TaxID=2758568 RepID=A0A7W2EF17_9BURK|nr:DUF4214 domain-containing protein [Rugamonas fusca]MBA5604738.1 DUF4214 domain-containing protein [Rugamonas fusca]